MEEGGNKQTREVTDRYADFLTQGVYQDEKHADMESIDKYE